MTPFVVILVSSVNHKVTIDLLLINLEYGNKTVGIAGCTSTTVKSSSKRLSNAVEEKGGGLSMYHY